MHASLCHCPFRQYRCETLHIPFHCTLNCRGVNTWLSSSQVVQTNPAMLQTVIQQIGAQSPEMLAAIQGTNNELLYAEICACFAFSNECLVGKRFCCFLCSRVK